jgi:autotransporter strand-loop-strand O-heptosyltransferase
MIYDNLKKNTNEIKPIENKVNFHFVRGPWVEIKGPKVAEYKIQFIDTKTGEVKFSSTIGNNCWCKCNIEYFVEWKILIYENNKLWYEYVYDATNKRVYIALDSKALGDSLSWFPYADEFRKKHNCKVVVSSFMNDMFIDQYPELEFVNPGTNVENLFAMYSVGLFYTEEGPINKFKNPIDPKTQTMQKMCSDILGLDYIEVRPKLKERKPYIDPNLKQVCIGVFGTAQSKFWNNPTGWQDVVDWLKNKGYTIRLLSKEGDDYMGNKLPTGIVQHPNGPLELVMDEMLKSKAFIGIGSGLSWLSWSLNVPTVLISGFSYDWAEMQDCYRVAAPKGKCEGCFNRLRLDPSDWSWCPDHKGTERQFECTKSITSEMVIKELQKFL